ncbi:MAG TPA: hypothetical protein VFC71_09845 [Candidatus Polarisedimenticolia bacterium]|nr:hypothetical protein [Candidatus Polarisedimenticolia bacterium]
MRRQPPYQSQPSEPGEVVPRPVRTTPTQIDDRAVLLDRSADGAELEIRPIATSRGARWTRVETLLGFGLVVLLFGGALVNALANALAEPTPTSTPGAVIGEATVGPNKTKAPETPRPTIEPTPAITPAVACAAPADNGAPPPVNLVAPGVDPIPGTVGAFTWFGAVQPPSFLRLDESGSIPFEGDIEFQIGGDVCATRWTIVSAPAQGDSAVQETAFSNQGQSDWASFTTNRTDNPIIAQQNHITARSVGIGRVYVRALLNFEGGHQAQVYWLIRIRGFDPPPIHVIGPDGTDVTPVVGCGVYLSTNDGSWYGEECPQGSWPVLEDGPTLTAHEGDIVRIEVPDWPLDYWGVQWAKQSDVFPGAEPSTVGNMGGSDSLNRTVVRWLVPQAGDWAIRIDLSHSDTNRQYGLPVHLRLRVLP